MASKFKLDVAPTFSAVVDIPVHGSEPVAVKFEFKHRAKADLVKWLDCAAGRSDTETLEDVLAGWELDDPFSKESIELLVQNYAGAAPAIVERYIDELIQARRKN